MRDYSPVSARLSFPSGETNKSFDLFIHNDQVFTGDWTFWIALTDATGGGQLAYPARAAITIVEGDRFGATESVTTNQLPDFLPTADPTGALQVYLEPAAAQGQWRLAGELFWRTSGELVSGLIDGMYYPAGIYLGEASQTLLRAIDGEVVDLINRAEASGNGGGNFTGGGVITISPLYTAATFASGYVQVRLGPPAAVAAGGAWRVAARNIDYTTNSNERIPLVGGGSFLIEFRPVPGWLLPTNQIVGVAADQETILDAYYIDAQPSLIYRLEEGMSRLSVSGASGASYRVEFATSLTTPVDWTPLTTFALVNSPFTVSNTLPATDASGFYRAVLVP